LIHNARKPHIACVLWEPDYYLRHNAILKSQALGQMRYLLSLGARITIICSDPSPNEFNKEFGADLEREGFQVIPIAKSGFKNFQTLMMFRQKLKKLNQKFAIDFFYFRNYWNFLAVPNRYIKAVFDLRGANHEETNYRAKRWGSPILNFKNRIYTYFERNAIKRANYMQCVSSPLKEYIFKYFLRDDVEVVNSCVEKKRFQNCRQNREKNRASLGIQPGDIVFLFLGGLYSYQEVDFMFSLWDRVARLIKNSKFLFYTSTKNYDTIKNNPLLSDIPSDRVIIKSVVYEDVPEHIAIADFGFLLRKDILLNRVASPVKFAEYLAAGLGVITSPGIGDFSKIVERHKVGCLVKVGNLEGGMQSISNLLDQFERDRSSFSSRAKEIAVTRLCWDSYKEYFLNRYFLSLQLHSEACEIEKPNL